MVHPSSPKENLSLTVAKFGGTSVADFPAMLRCAQIIKNDCSNRLVVVSASAGVTNYLVRLSQANLSLDEQADIIDKIQAIQLNITQHLAKDVEQALNTEIKGLLKELATHALKQSQQHSVKQGDAILSFGEQLSSRIFAQVLQSIDVNGAYFNVQQVMKTNSLYGKAVVDIEQLSLACTELLAPKLTQQVLVTQGFIGQDGLGETTTLGRGGSDYSAALLAEALHANNLSVWTDVVGIFTTDPRITDQARAIKEISFGEAAEMATFGAKILHPATLIPAMRQNIPVFVGSSKEPEKGGTQIKKSVASNPTYRSIALRREQTLVTVKSPAMLHASGFLAQVFGILAKHELSVDLITTSEISVALTFDNPSGSTQALITSTVVEELEQLCEVTVEHGLSLVAVIGNGLDCAKGIGQRIFQTINDISVRLICHGASANNLCFLVNERDANNVVEKLHGELFN
ncbi:lysine-sensitive aspartokinase 3 [Colwellia sp. 4_MG-2023]|uniref:lysine-sensitive aspartokinase 3 n=1 Tax=unclassified Colwellia TaxID=196834 RepID=UPI0026E377D0|nr:MULTISPECIES: lysine-sensitive aspartokinase 3 [unclassified Colwellia]MDO6507890.1 lysine-sensitive aspartokinase 3 [Colwellia sp. 5_MG-2023]MDO6556557.1 lysine-sensitive aspartokinase 3 [Colwellia sp. 4_MG-2023]